MNRVDHDELAGLRAQKGVRILQSTAIDRTFEIEVDGGSGTLGSDFPRQSGLADLTGSQ